MEHKGTDDTLRMCRVIWMRIFLHFQRYFFVWRDPIICLSLFVVDCYVRHLKFPIRSISVTMTLTTRKEVVKRKVLITKTCLYSFDPLKHHVYTVKLEFTGVNINFLISAQNIDCGYSLEPPRQGSSNEYLKSMFWVEIWKISEFLFEILHFFGGKIFSIFE